MDGDDERGTTPVASRHRYRVSLLVVVTAASVVVGGVTVLGAVHPRPAAAHREVAVMPPPADDVNPSAAGTGSTAVVTSDPAWLSAPVTTTTRAVPTPVALPSGPLAPVLSRVPTPDRVIFLGIDDGLIRDPAVLAFLRDQKIPTTSFIVSGSAHADPQFWRDAIAAGTTVEAHTLTHPDLTKISTATQQKEICGPADDFQKLFGRRPVLFRPPYGAYNDSVRRIAASCGYRAVLMWVGSTNDGRFDLQDPNGKLRPGDVILMHWRSDLLDNLKTVVARCEQQGFAIARLEDYLAPGT